MNDDIASWRLGDGVAAGVIAHAAAEHPREACGLLLGRGSLVEAAVATRNVAEHPTHAFEIEPAALLRVHREARGAGRQIVGWYHSHPNGDGTPSRRDAARAVEDGKLWLIAAAGALRGWAVTPSGPVEGRFAAVTLLA